MSALRSLYVSYFGVREPLVQRQVLPYLVELRKDLESVSLLTFEPVLPKRWAGDELASVRGSLGRRSIGWSYLAYHKQPTLPATAFDILLGGLRIARLARRDRYGILHCRGHVPMAMGVLAKRFARLQLIFDIRGFMPEEYVDAGIWPPHGSVYRLTKHVERHLFSAADAFVVLTERAREHLFAGRTDRDERGRPIAVVPCCVDFNEFNLGHQSAASSRRAILGLEGRRVYVYVGQLGGWYLDDVLVEFLGHARARDSSSFAIVLTTSPSSELRARLQARGYDDSSLILKAVAPEHVPSYLLAGDVGLSFIKPCFSKISSSPTKIGEYLAMGLPVVTTSGIGDVDALITGNRAGWLMQEFSAEAYEAAASGIAKLLQEKGVKTRLRSAAKTVLDLESVGGPLYRQLYARLASRKLGGP